MGSNAVVMPEYVTYKKVVVPQNIDRGGSVASFLLDNYIPDCVSATVAWRYDYATNPPDYHLITMLFANVKNKSASVKSGVRFRSGNYQAVSIDQTYDARVKTGEILDVYIIKSAEEVEENA